MHAPITCIFRHRASCRILRPQLRRLLRSPLPCAADASSSTTTVVSGRRTIAQDTSQPAGSHLLVLNTGSSSLKFKTFTLSSPGTKLEPGLGGVLERIGEGRSRLLAKGTSPATGERRKWEVDVPAQDHVQAMQAVVGFLKEHVSGTITQEVMAVGHRVVHGLDISQPRELDPDVIETIKRAALLAPLHNPAALQGIEAATKVFEGTPQVAVFDTAFHATMPAAAYMYALPYDLYSKHHVRRYGFHGTSHEYLVRAAAQMLGKSVESVDLITCHLGNGSSMAAVKSGKCVDTSMGLTPLEGLVMGTRCGDIDPAVVLHLQTELGLSAKEVDKLMNKQSGLLGLCGENDLRSVIAKRDKGDARAVLALDAFVYRIRKYIGAYLAALGGTADAIVFSAGVGENSAPVRQLVCLGLQAMGIDVDEARNQEAVGGKQLDISGPGAKVRVLVIPTDEELSIAQQTLAVVDAKVHHSN